MKCSAEKEIHLTTADQAAVWSRVRRHNYSSLPRPVCYEVCGSFLSLIFVTSNFSTEAVKVQQIEKVAAVKYSKMVDCTCWFDTVSSTFRLCSPALHGGLQKFVKPD